VGGMFLAPSSADAADLRPRLQPAPVPGVAPPAGEGINFKAGGMGGGRASREFYAGMGSVSLPLGGQFGLQIDGLGGSLGGRGTGGIGGALLRVVPGAGRRGA